MSIRFLATLVAVSAFLMAPLAASAATVPATLDFDTPNSVFQFTTSHPSGNTSIVNGNCLAGSCLSIRANNQGGGETVTLSRVDGGTFSVEGFWFQLLGNALDNTLNVASDTGYAFSFPQSVYGNNLGVSVGIGGLVGVSSFTFQNFNRGGLRIDDIRVSYEDIAPVPLPATGLLLLAGVGGLAAMRRRRRAA